MLYYAYIPFAKSNFPFCKKQGIPKRQKYGCSKNEWGGSSYEKEFLGLFETYKGALAQVQNFEPNFSEWEELCDSYLQDETVFVKS